MKIAVIAHIYYQDLVDELVYYFRNLPDDSDIYISTPPEYRGEIERIFSEVFGAARVRVRGVENRGMDIAPFLSILREVGDRYDVVCHVHSKKSTHTKYLAGWRGYLLENLLGSNEIVEKILSYFEHDQVLGIVFPEHFPFVYKRIGWGANYSRAQEMAQKMDMVISQEWKIDFPSGSMFWCRPKSLEKLINLNLSESDFDNPVSLIDGQLEHAIERLFLEVIKGVHYSSKKILFRPMIKNRYSDKLPVIDFSDHLNALNQSIYDLFDIMDESRKKFQSKSIENATIKSENATIKSENATIKSENATIKSENALLQRTVEAIYQSRSWRITKPLRRIGDYFRNTGVLR